MSQHFPKRYSQFDGNVKVEPNLSNCATESAVIKIARVDRSTFAEKVDLTLDDKVKMLITYIVRNWKLFQLI